MNLQQIDPSWTLFLDRDGVINYEKYNDYIHKWEEFVFYEGALEAIQIFSKHFNRIVIVTNQKGIGKGLTRPIDLEEIHNNMVAAIQKEGGRIDAIYFCSDLDDNSPNRKPNPGMGLQASRAFPEIDFKKSLMVGNNFSDMQFGRNLGMHTIFLATTHFEGTADDDRIDARYHSLIDLAHALPADKL
jgi:histidinol-phosphate phosphatase family protein